MKKSKRYISFLKRVEREILKLVDELLSANRTPDQIQDAVEKRLLELNPYRNLYNEFINDSRVIARLASKRASERYKWYSGRFQGVEGTRRAINVFAKTSKGFAKVAGLVQKPIVKALMDGIKQKRTQTEITEIISSKFKKPLANAGTIANTGLAGYSNTTNFEYAKTAGIEKFRYAGPSAERDFCDKHVGKIYTEKELSALNNGQGLEVIEFCGGYNCRHYLDPVIE